MTSTNVGSKSKLVGQLRTSERLRAGLLLALVTVAMVIGLLFASVGGRGSSPEAAHPRDSGPPSGIEVLGAMNGPH